MDAAGAKWALKDPVTITKLPYELNGLEPVIPLEIMEYHYGKHHTAYCTKYNDFMPKYHEAIASNNTDLANDLLPKIQFNYGGYWNHDQYWLNLTGVGTGGGDYSKAPGVVAEIKNEWGTVDNFINFFNTKTAGIMGSGWGWLVWDKNNKAVKYLDLKDQDLVSEQGNGQYVGLLTIDIWEHAFYLKWKNLKGEYLKDVWQLLNWEEVEKRYKAASA